ncbi:MAG: hypothetical protein R2747_00370 [Pyrinomonadaceae bacterium]
MIYLPILLFAAAAALGVIILSQWLRKRQAPKTVIYSHGGAAAAALVLLIVYALQNPDNFPRLGLILLIVAALGGFVLFFAEMFAEKRLIPVGVLHALIAVGGFLALVLFAFG